MRVLVVSDSHGDWHSLRRVVMAQPKAEVVIHLGDGESDFDDFRYEFTDKMFVNVAGNCDFVSTARLFDTITVEGKRIFFTHGHMYSVKSGLDRLKKAAIAENADICLFGHTHIPLEKYEDGLYIMNPGSLGHPKNGIPSYGIIDVTPMGIMTNIVYLH